jgi:hypothetical protein
MAESSQADGSHGTDVLRKKIRRPVAADGSTPVRRLKKRPLKRKPTAPAPVKDTLGLMSSSRFAGHTEKTDERLLRKPTANRKLKRPPGAELKAKGNKLVKRKVRRKLTPEEIEAKRLKDEAERLKKEAAEAEARLTDEEREQIAKEAEIKRQEEERKKQEEIERLKLEAAEKIKLEAEAKRLEEEKQRQEQERERIFKKIEYYKPNLTTEEIALAEKIASEMVQRNIKWSGYITLHGGIGGAMLKD